MLEPRDEIREDILGRVRVAKPQKNPRPKKFMFLPLTVRITQDQYRYLKIIKLRGSCSISEALRQVLNSSMRKIQ